MMKHIYGILSFAALACASAQQVQANDYSFRLKNALGFARQNETVEVQIPGTDKFNALTLSSEDGKVIPFELCGQHGIRFQCSIAHGSTMGYELTETLTGMRYEKLEVKNAGWFDLSGRRITQPVQKGIYIVDGKKTTVK